jgi:cold-inducible RNA-binding protein
VNIYVGNLSYDSTEQEIQELFSGFGDIASVKVITDKFSGRSKGFAFVEMASKDQAESAIEQLNGKEFKGRTIVVSEARPKRDDDMSR